jgi:hypothetical protein
MDLCGVEELGAKVLARLRAVLRLQERMRIEPLPRLIDYVLRVLFQRNPAGFGKNLRHGARI